jgi:hypothetical protein
MKYFGGRHSAICADLERIEAPTCAPCAHCGELIRATDDGFALPVLGEPILAAYHRECFLRAIVGSVAHQRRLCSCYVPGATCGDNPKLSTREAARYAVQMWERRG